MKQGFASRTSAAVALTASALLGAVIARTAPAGAGTPPPPPPPPPPLYEVPVPTEPRVEMPTSADLAAFHATVLGADRIVAHGRDGTAAPGRFESSDRRDVTSLDAALQMSAPEAKMRDFCEGTPEVKLYREGTLVAVITYHHGVAMRVAGWGSDVFLDDPEPLIGWFADRGIPGPRREADEAAEVERRADAWFAAMPSSLQPFWDDMRDADWPDFDLAPLRAPLAKQFPSARDRVRALYGWYGSGRGLWSGYPAYEDAAEHLLLEYSIADLLAAAEEPGLTTAELEGAARLFGGWDFSRRRADDLSKLPPSLKARLLAHSLVSDDSDKRGRAEAAFAP